MTRQRALIARILRTAGRHLTAEEIYLLARRSMPSIAVGTVYRNLRLMTEDGEVRRIEAAGGPVRYDANLSPHGHLVCRVCGKLEDVAVPCLSLYLSRCTGEAAPRYDLSVDWVCPVCRRARESGGESDPVDQLLERQSNIKI